MTTPKDDIADGQGPAKIADGLLQSAKIADGLLQSAKNLEREAKVLRSRASLLYVIAGADPAGDI